MGVILKRFVLTAAMIAIATGARADRYYTGSDRPGWWWKNDPAEEQKEPEKQQPVQKQAEKKDDKPRKLQEYRISDYPAQKLWDMHPDEFQALLDDFKKQAVRKPSEENVRGYLTMQDVARRKAYAYSNVAQMVLQKYPELSAERDYPVTGPGKDALRRMTEEDVSRRVTAARANYALVYFHKDDCPYCVAQEKILSYFIDSRKWLVKGVNVSASSAIAARFSVSITPTILLIKEGEEGYLPLSSGVISLNELEERIYNGVRLLDGEITPEQFNMREFQRGGAFDATAPLSR